MSIDKEQVKDGGCLTYYGLDCIILSFYFQTLVYIREGKLSEEVTTVMIEVHFTSMKSSATNTPSTCMNKGVRMHRMT